MDSKKVVSKVEVVDRGSLNERLEQIRSERDVLKAEFKKTLDEMYAKHRAEMKLIRDEKDAAWAEYNKTRSEEKAEMVERKAAAKKEADESKKAPRRVRAKKNAAVEGADVELASALVEEVAAEETVDGSKAE